MTKDVPVHLTVPHFSVRCDVAMPLAEMAAKVSSALGCQLVEGDYHKIPGASGILLGMDVGLFKWGGARGPTFRFQGEVESAAFADFMQDRPVQVSGVNLSQMVADVLTVVTGTSWRIPTAEDFAAERAYDDVVERNFAQDPDEDPEA